MSCPLYDSGQFLLVIERIRSNCSLHRMRKVTKSHRIFKDRAMNCVDDLQGMFMNPQSARKENRNIDMAVLEEQVHQMLKEWKKELNEPSPTPSLQQGASLGSFHLTQVGYCNSMMKKMMQLADWLPQNLTQMPRMLLSRSWGFLTMVRV